MVTKSSPRLILGSNARDIIETIEHPVEDYLQFETLTAAQARASKDFLQSSPHTASGRLLLAGIEDSRPEALHPLLDLLESLPASSTVVLWSTKPVPETIMSRCQVTYAPVLSMAQVEQLLVERHRVSPDDAESAAKVSSGSISKALTYLMLSDEKRDVFAVLRAFEAHSYDMLEVPAKTWDESRTEMLHEWCKEAITKETVVFRGAEINLDSRVPLRILMSLRENVNPRIFVRGTLASLI